VEPARGRPAGAPRFEIRQVFSDGTESEPEFLSVLEPPWEARMDRRDFLRAGLTASAVLALLSACGPGATSAPGGASASPKPTETPSSTPSSSPPPTASPGRTPKATAKPTPRKTPKPTPRKTPKPTPKPRTCTCHIVGGCSCNTVCSCNKICTCIPVCQAHRLLDPDPTIRTMAEEIVLVMGAHEMAYLAWAAAAAEPALRERITTLVAGIRQGATPDPARWPTVTACAPYLDHDDPVVALMSAQMMDLHRTWQGAELGEVQATRVRERLAHGKAMRWRPEGARRQR
jgi:hypothetical protein